MVKKIVITGPTGSGKDTFINLLKQKFNTNNNYNIINISTVIPIKKMMKKYSISSRQLISDIKKIIFNKDGNCFLFYSNVQALSNLNLNKKNIIFVHSREIEELYKFKKNGYKVLYIDRIGYDFKEKEYSSVDIECQEAKGFCDILVRHESFEELNGCAESFKEEIIRQMGRENGK